MELLLVALGILVGGGCLALAASRLPRCSNFLGAFSAVLGGAIGLIPTIGVLFGQTTTLSLRVAWSVPGGAFLIEMDRLSAFFAFIILFVPGLAAIYGFKYLEAFLGRKTLGIPWFFYNLLIAAMLMVVLARNGVLFLIVWEVMAVSAFFLVSFEDEKESVRSAALIYLIATHLGTAILFALFVLLGQPGGSLDFDTFQTPGADSSISASLLFLLALVGFGTKAGLVPVHVWLPEAHPVAPSHVSAVMSGVIIKTGIYGLVRVLTFLGTPPAWWAWLLIGIGLATGVFGIMSACMQRDLKRMLAFSSVENIGIIALGLGTGLLGLSAGAPGLAVLGFGGAFLHVLNHSFFKCLLFLAAGVILHETGTRDMEQLGGLMKRMPRTALVFLIGAAAICGLPPLNGFIGEYLIFAGALEEEMTLGTHDALAAIPPLAIISGLALIGGLAVFCFTKAFGIIFLGTARSPAATHVHDPNLLMVGPMAVLAVGCIAIGFAAPWLLTVLEPVMAIPTGVALETIEKQMAEEIIEPTQSIVMTSTILLLFVLGLTALRWRLLRDRAVDTGETWGCGYAAPTARMQYTASSYTQPLAFLLGSLVKIRAQVPILNRYFPAPQSLQTETDDPWLHDGYQPLFRGIGALFARLHWLQPALVHSYVLYIALTIVTLLVWHLRGKV